MFITCVRRKSRILTWGICLFSSLYLFGQNNTAIPLNNNSEKELDRYEQDIQSYIVPVFRDNEFLVNEFNFKSYLTPISGYNTNKGRMRFTTEVIINTLDDNPPGNKECTFYLPQGSSSAADTITSIIKSFEGYRNAHDPSFNTDNNAGIIDPLENFTYSSSYITANNEKLVSGLIDCDEFTGGAHPYKNNITFIIRIVDGKQLTIKDLIKENALEHIKTIAHMSYLMTYFGSLDSTSNEDDSYDLKKNGLFNQNKENGPYIEPVELFEYIFVTKYYLFLYIPTYVFGSGAQGDCYVPISIDSLKSYLTPLGLNLLK